MKDLAVAYNLMRHNKKKMAHGGTTNEKLHPNREPMRMMAHGGAVGLAKAIGTKRMGKGGCFADGGEVGMGMDSADDGLSDEDDFLSNEMSSDVPHLGYPDPDGKEADIDEDPKMGRKGALSNIMRQIRYRHTGKE